MEEDDVVSSAKFSASDMSFFADREEVLGSISCICSELHSHQWEHAWEKFSASLSKYQEQPLLLNPSLEEMTTPLFSRMLSLCVKLELSNEFSKSEEVDGYAGLLHVCKCIQLICRVRGVKYIAKYFPHEVDQMEVNIRVLKAKVINETIQSCCHYLFAF